MHYLILYILLLALVATPAILIFFSSRLSGRTKAKWVVRAALAPFLPGVIYAIGLVVAVKLGGYDRTLGDMLFGPEAYGMAAANLASVAMPWIVLYLARGVVEADSRANQPAAAGHEPLIRQNHQDWKDAVYNPKEHRGRRG